ncbi:MAG: EscE/YscE/SsaE family type III secretion system needle protein co-chaperone [Ramlibacter sp.]
MAAWTELEERLMTEGDALRAQLTTQLEQAALRLKARLAVPIPREEFAACNVCSQALDAALQVLGRWAPAMTYSSPPASGVVARR